MDDETTGSAADPISRDAVLDLVLDPRCRGVLELFLRHERPLTVNDLTKELLAREHESPITEIPGDEVTRVAVSLHHYVCPKLADVGVLTYDADRRLAAPTARLERLEPHLSAAPGTESTPELSCCGEE